MGIIYYARKYILIGLVVISILAIAIACGLYFKSNRLSAELDNTNIELSVKTDTIMHLKDKNGKDFARIREYEKSVYDLKNTNDALEKKMYEEAKNNKLKDKQIAQLQYALINANGQIVVIEKPINILDSNAREIRFYNGNLDACISFIPNKDTITLDYSYRTELFVTKSTYRPKSDYRFFRWLGISFKKKKMQYDFKLSDPNAIIDTARVIDIKK